MSNGVLTLSLLPPAEPDNVDVEGVSNELPRGPELLLGAGVHLGGLVEGVLRGVEGLVPRAWGPGECGAVRECSDWRLFASFVSFFLFSGDSSWVSPNLNTVCCCI